MSDKKYSKEQILELVGGDKYFSRNQIEYTYYKLNGDDEKAAYFYELCQEEVKQLQDTFNKMKKIEEIEEINNNNKEKSIDI